MRSQLRRAARALSTVTSLSLLLALAVSGCGGASSGNTTTTTGGVGSNGAFVLSPTPGTALPPAVAGQAYSETITVESGGVPPYTFVLVNGANSGLSLSSSTTDGTLSGTPGAGQVGVTTVQFTVQDATLTKQSYSYSFEVKPATPALTITPTTLPQGSRPQPYNLFLLVSGGVSPFTWSVGSGSLPPGLMLATSTSSSVQISGTPTTAGTFTFTIDVADGDNPQRTGSQSLSLTIQ